MAVALAYGSKFAPGNRLLLSLKMWRRAGVRAATAHDLVTVGRLSDGTGNEEQVFRYTPGAGLNLTDISPDGRFMVCDSGGGVQSACSGIAQPDWEFTRITAGF